MAVAFGTGRIQMRRNFTWVLTGGGILVAVTAHACFFGQPGSLASLRLTQTGAGNSTLAVVSGPIVIDQSGCGEADLSLRNTSSIPIRIERVQTSCPCVSLSPLPMLIDVREVKVLRVSFTPTADDAELDHRLRVQIVGYAADSTVVVQAAVVIEPGALGDSAGDSTAPMSRR